MEKDNQTSRLAVVIMKLTDQTVNVQGGTQATLNFESAEVEPSNGVKKDRAEKDLENTG